jgi:hypothetical protein
MLSGEDWMVPGEDACLCDALRERGEHQRAGELIERYRLAALTIRSAEL